MKTFEGIIQGLRGGCVRVELSDGKRIDLKAGEAVQAQAEALQGRRVRFQAELHESTLSLSSPIFVIGSSMGLVAAQAQAVAAE